MNSMGLSKLGEEGNTILLSDMKKEEVNIVERGRGVLWLPINNIFSGESRSSGLWWVS